ncbi:MAG: hypothetical protein R2856_01100 [Caldilineaceae bacterium]
MRTPWSWCSRSASARLVLAARRQHHMAAFLRQFRRNRRADATAGPCHNRDFVTQIHDGSFL